MEPLLLREGSVHLGKAVSFIGSTPNIGTTYCALTMAVKLAERTTDELLYLCLNLKSSKLHRYLGHDKPAATLDEIRAAIRSKSLKPDQITSFTHQFKAQPNLHFLYGNMLREQAEYFTSEDIEMLLDAVRRRYKLCILDVNAYWDNAATVTALLAADQRMMVTSNEITHFQEDIYRWVKSVGPLFQLYPEDFYLIINRPAAMLGRNGFKSKDVERETRMKLMQEVEYEPNVQNSINEGGLFHYIQSNAALGQAWKGTVDWMESFCDLEPREKSSSEVTWIKRFISI